MTIEQVVKMFPERSLAVFRVERGSANDRKMVWLVGWDAGYFTTDTDRHAYHGRGSETACADSMEDALSALVKTEMTRAKSTVEYHEEALSKARDALSAVARRLEGGNV